MQINYNVSGSDRKQLVAAIAQHTGEKGDLRKFCVIDENRQYER